MTPDQQNEAVELRKKHQYSETDSRAYDTYMREHRYSFPAKGGEEFGALMTSVIGDISKARNLRKAKKHYKQNASAYQVQAVKDAHAEGVETNFGNRNEQKAA